VQLFRFKAALREGARPCHGLLSQAEATRIPSASFPQPFYTSANTQDHSRGAPCHPRTQGKIERWHQTLKNRILLENYFLPGDLERQIAGFVDHYNHRRYHESISNLTPADVYFGRGDIIMMQRERIKRETITQRRLLHREAAA